MKCYPVIRGCGVAKVLCGLALIAAGLWIRGEEWSLDCESMSATCPAAFQEMIAVSTGNSQDAVAASESAEATAYCDCLASCMNYMSVYESNKVSAEPTNCYPLSAAAGVPEVAGNVPSSGVASDPNVGTGSGQTTIPGTDATVCSSCSGMEEHLDKLITFLAIFAISAGVALMITAGCEHLELKWHGRGYAMCVLFTDCAVGVWLIAALCVAISGLVVAQAACEPEDFEAAVEDGGNDSTNNSPDQSAAFATFFMKVSLPIVKGSCSLKNPFSLYAAGMLIGMFSSFTSFLASCAVCTRMSDDGLDNFDSDQKAVQLQYLMNNGAQ
eukprot:TRINITY_DN34628_c0_g1_i1.p1 TRINITY_DN34628_c0_g1~~TRINITY_DN34628_c0_g1_i1.p1  ORF type:complete len:327 (-),score=73.80 TRINITY_DN34628_c0_g1_i1:364-1344(-)